MTLYDLERHIGVEIQFDRAIAIEIMLEFGKGKFTWTRE